MSTFPRADTRCSNCGRDVEPDIAIKMDYCSACGHPIERTEEDPGELGPSGTDARLKPDRPSERWSCRDRCFFSTAAGARGRNRRPHGKTENPHQGPDQGRTQGGRLDAVRTLRSARASRRGRSLVPEMPPVSPLPPPDERPPSKDPARGVTQAGRRDPVFAVKNAQASARSIERPFGRGKNPASLEATTGPAERCS